MRAHRASGRARAGILLALLGIALAGGGCVAAGLAATGPLFTAVQLVTDRSVERTLAADLSTASRVTAQSLVRMALRVRDPERDGEAIVLEGMGTRVTVRAELSPVTPAMTRLSVRAEAGRLTADKRTAEEILNQVASSLASQASSTTGDMVASQLNAQVETLTTLRGEVARLRAKLDEDGAAKRTPATPPSVGPSVTVPVARGVVEVSTAHAFPRSAQPTEGPAPVDRSVVQPAARRVASDDAGEAPALAPQLTPVGLLTPVQPLIGPRSGE